MYLFNVVFYGSTSITNTSLHFLELLEGGLSAGGRGSVVEGSIPLTDPCYT